MRIILIAIVAGMVAIAAHAQQVPNPDGSKPEANWAYNQQGQIPFENCVNHMIAARPVFLANYSAADDKDHLDLARSEQKVAHMCEAPFEQACYGESGNRCFWQAYGLIGRRLLEAWKRDH